MNVFAEIKPKSLLFVFVGVLLLLAMDSIQAGAQIEISSIEELQLIGNDPDYPLDGDYVLTQDIDASDTVNWNGGAGFEPIGVFERYKPELRFSGTFDGQGHVVENLVIRRGRLNENMVGLFRLLTSDGIIRNVGLKGCWITGSSSVGGLVGSSDGTISQTYVSGVVSGAGREVGGLVGANRGTVSQSYASAGVIGVGDEVGGLVGRNTSGEISDSFAVGRVMGRSDVGGLAGGSRLGTVLGSFWDIEVGGIASSAGGMGLTTEEMTTVRWYRNAGWADTSWVMAEGEHPRLAWEDTGDEPIPEPEPLPLLGNGTESDPYQIGAAEELALLSRHRAALDAHIVLTSDVDCAGIALHPIGDLGPFNGIFDGRGHVIRNVVLAVPERDYVGVFGIVGSEGEIHGVGVEDAHVKGRHNVGGLAGYCEGGISASHVTGAVSGDTYVGGIVGRKGRLFGHGTVSTSYTTSSVKGVEYVGGIVGYNRSGSVLVECYATGAVTGENNVGGIVGYTERGLVSECYATGAVTGESNVGGLIGHIRAGFQGSGGTSECYATGTVTGDGSNIGGLVGGRTPYTHYEPGQQRKHYLPCPITGGWRTERWYEPGRTLLFSPEVLSSFWDIDTSSYEESNGGVGLSTSEMQTESTFTERDWDFEDTWYMVAGGSYPYLKGLPQDMVPDVAELSEEEAIEVVEAAGLTARVTYVASQTVPAGHVVSQGVPVGAGINRGAPLDLAVSFGEPIAVPAVEDMPLADAETAIADADLTVGGVTEHYSSTTPAGHVINQTPEAGVERGRGSAVELTVSAGPVPQVIRISSIEELQLIGNHQLYPLDGNYILTRDINASVTATWDDGAGFEPIGAWVSDRPEAAFTGTFNGQGHVITGLTIDRPEDSGVGLFGALGEDGILQNLVLDHSSVSGENSVGGLVAVNMGVIMHCTVGGAVAGESQVGGLAGGNWGAISDCGATATVTGMGEENSGVGGLVGYSSSSSASVSRSYAVADVAGDMIIGGLVGLNDEGVVSESYAAGTVSGLLQAGGLIGLNKDGSVSNSYAICDVGDEGVGFGGLVGQNYGGDAEILECWASGTVIGAAVIGGLVGENSEGVISESWAAATVTGDIAAGGLVGINGQEGTVSKCHAEAEVTGEGIIGGLVGWNVLKGVVSQSYAKGTVTGEEVIGGLAGMNTHESLVSQSYANATVTGDTGAGGLVGANTDESMVSQSYAQGEVMGNALIGGLVGASDGTVAESYAAALVSGQEHIGGLLGMNDGGAVDASFWDTAVSGTAESDGGIGLNTEEMQTRNTFLEANWDFEEFWNIDDGESYPYWTGSLQITLHSVPDVRGMAKTAAETRTTEAGLYIGNVDEEFSTAVPAGTVIRQYPPPDTKVGPSSTIDLVVSLGSKTFSVPEVEGADTTEAETALLAEGLRVGEVTEEYSATVPEGHVIRQELASGTEVDLGSAVDLVVSLGPESPDPVLVPDVVGMSKAAAEGALIGAGLSVGNVSEQYSDDVPEGDVIGQNPLAGTEVAEGSAVDLVVSLGIVPDIIPISSIEQLQLIGNDPNYPLDGDYVLTQDIDASDTVNWNDGAGFEPIGMWDYGQPELAFTGTFDGQGHVITDLFIERRYEEVLGLFAGISEGGVIENLGLEGGAVTGRLFVGSLVGANAGTVEHSYATSAVEANGVVGGLVGVNADGIILQSFATGPVTGEEGAGGLLGANGFQHTGGTVLKSYATGPVTCYELAGGLIGTNAGSVSLSYATGAVTGNALIGGLIGGNNGTVSQCFATGAVTGEEYVGGLAGSSTRGTVSQCYATGFVSGGDWFTGGLVGHSSESTVEASFWDVETSGMTESDGGTGLPTADMQKQNTFITVGWDFEQTWGIDEGVSYPYLQALGELEWVRVPELAGIARTDAEAILIDAGLTIGTVTEEHHDSIPKGDVISQNPSAGAEVAEGSAVDLVVSLGLEPPDPVLVSVPDVSGMAQTVAEAALTEAGLSVGNVSEQYSDDVPSGDVISQDPAAGTEVAEGSAVDLVVSLGPEPPDPVLVSVPDVSGMAQTAAEAVLTEAGLSVGNVSEQYSDDVPSGDVISQNPSVGAEVAEGSAVDLVISRGPTLAGSLTVIIEPKEAVDAGAYWRRKHTPVWHSSGSTEDVIPAGVYEVEFRDVSGWATPDVQEVTIEADETEIIVATYVQNGSLEVTIEPLAAREAGAQWRRVGTAAWQDSGATETDVSADNHEVEFKDIDGWNTPGTITISVPASGTGSGSGTYTLVSTPDPDPDPDPDPSPGIGCGGAKMADVLASMRVPTIYEHALPATRIDENTRLATLDSTLAIRLRGEDAIEPETVWGMASWSDGHSQAVYFVYADDEADGWAVYVPEMPWIAGDEVTFTAGAETISGVPVGPELFTFIVTEEVSAEEVTLTAAYSHPDGVGLAWQIGPDALYDEPVTVQIPVPTGYDPSALEVGYHFVSDATGTLVSAERVAGWLVPDSVHVVSDDSGAWIELTVRHGGIVQLKQRTLTNAPAGMSTNIPRGDLLVLLAMTGIIVLVAAYRRRTLRS